MYTVMFKMCNDISTVTMGTWDGFKSTSFIKMVKSTSFIKMGIERLVQHAQHDAELLQNSIVLRYMGR